MMKSKKDGGPLPGPGPKYNMPISCKNVNKAFEGAADFFARKVVTAGFEAQLFFIDGLTSGSEISEYVLKPLMLCTQGAKTAKEFMERLRDSEIYACTGKTVDSMDALCSKLVNGFAVIVVEGEALAFEAKTGEKRSISEPSTEDTVKGSKDAFVETVRTNTSLVRRHLRTPKLRIKEIIVGRQSLTNISIIYIEGLTNPGLVDSLEKRIAAMDVDGVLTVSTLGEYLFEGKSLFPRLMYTQRTDRFCYEVMGGRVGMLVDGMPLGFLMPATLAQIMKTPEDRSENYIVASALRLLRYMALIITLLLPGVYLAVRTFHWDMLPPVMLQSILESKEQVAAGTAFEVIALLLAFELLQESGLRMPQNIGQTIGVIGGLVVGTAAVDANIISPVVLVMISLAGVAGYTLPNQDFSNAVRVWRFLIVLAAWGFGLFGVLVACLAMLASLAKLESFGVPYLSPFITGNGERMLDELLVEPITQDIYRQRELQTLNKRRRR